MDKKEILEYFNKKFDTDLSRRLRKFREEYDEFLHAFAFEDRESQVDELLAMVVDKVKGREKDPNYKRKHPHVENKGCE